MLINARILTLMISEAYEVQEFSRDLKTEELSLPVMNSVSLSAPGDSRPTGGTAVQESFSLSRTGALTS